MTTSRTFESTPMMRAVAAAVRANVPTLIWGNPGTGKTAKLANHGEAWGYHTETIVGSIREPSDFMGLPVADEAGTKVSYVPLDWALRLADADKGLLLLDELTTAPPSVQRAMLRILQEREVGNLTLPETVSIIAIANPPEIAVDGWDLAAPVANRLMHLEWHFDHDEWLEGVLTGFEDAKVPDLDSMIGRASDVNTARVHGGVTAYLRAKPQALMPLPPTDPTLAGRAWPSPRSWTNAMTVLSHLDPNDEEAASLVVQGCVGEGAGREYMAWVRTMDLVDPDLVLRDPSIVNWSEERPDRLFALIGAVAALVTIRGGGLDVWNQGVNVLVACASGDKPDVATPAARKLLNNKPKGGKIPKAAAVAFADVLRRTGRLSSETVSSRAA